MSTVGNNWILDDCNHKIDGWYQDTLQHRWDGDHLDRLYLVNIEKNQTYHALEAKAAHGLLVYTYRSFINCYAFILY